MLSDCFVVSSFNASLIQFGLNYMHAAPAQTIISELREYRFQDQ